MRSFLVLLFLGVAAQAASRVNVTTHFADLPAGGEVPATVERLSKTKGATVLSSPTITVMENVAGTVDVVQDTPVPGGGQVSLGVSLTVKTSITERGSIWFSGNIRDRSRGGGEKTEKLETVGFATREWYFSGYTNDGGTVVIRTAPAMSQVIREGKTVTSSRELVAYVKFEKIAEKAPERKPATSGKTPTTKKATTPKSKSGLRR